MQTKKEMLITMHIVFHFFYYLFNVGTLNLPHLLARSQIWQFLCEIGIMEVLLCTFHILGIMINHDGVYILWALFIETCNHIYCHLV